MKFYLAGKHEWRDMIGDLISQLEGMGHECTFNWTMEEDYNLGFKEPATVAELCMMGVDRCDGFIAILPGGPGTHTELGFARASDKFILLAVHENCRDLLMPSSGLVFYHGDKITHIIIQDGARPSVLVDDIHHFLTVAGKL